jgi:hypothetical protein
MWQSAVDLLEGFWTPYTPMSFLSGVGVHHLYCKYWRDRPEKEEGTTRVQEG